MSASMMTSEQVAHTTALALVEERPAVMLTDAEKFDRLYDALRSEVATHVPDLTTDKGRKEIASLAYRVTRTKTAIDEAGKKLNEAARKQIAVVDAARREIRTKLEVLALEARKPLTDWEQAEAARAAKAQAYMAECHAAAAISLDDTSVSVAARSVAIQSKTREITEAELGDLFPAVCAEVAHTFGVLSAAVIRLRKQERDQAELERLRAEAAARAERDRIRAEQEAAQEAARQAAEREAEEARLAAVHEQEAIASAAEEARLAAERAALVEREAQERRHQADLQRVKDEQFAREQMRLQAEQKERDRIDQEKAEAEQRAKDRAHRGAVMKTVKEALMLHALLTEDGARDVVKAIVSGSIPNVSIQF